jgi:hypothetical protein
MSTHLRRWLWRLAKTVIVIAILVGVGWTFYRNFEQLDREALEWWPAWLAFSGLCYFLGSSCCALFWWRLLRALGQRPTFFAALRAYHTGGLGKYVPGKALVPILRTALVRTGASTAYRGEDRGGVRTGVAFVTVFYETFTIMAAGAILSAGSLSKWLTGTEQLLILLAIGAAVAFFLAPPVFNRLAAVVLKRFRKSDSEPLPPLRIGTLLAGLALGAVNWVFLGLSLVAAILAVRDEPPTLELVVECTAFVALATVLGFVTPSPGGLGVREWLLAELLTPQLGPGPATVVAILLRLTWIVAELATAGVLYPAPLLFSKRG